MSYNPNQQGCAAASLSGHHNDGASINVGMPKDDFVKWGSLVLLSHQSTREGKALWALMDIVAAEESVRLAAYRYVLECMFESLRASAFWGISDSSLTQTVLAAFVAQAPMITLPPAELLTLETRSLTPSEWATVTKLLEVRINSSVRTGPDAREVYEAVGIAIDHRRVPTRDALEIVVLESLGTHSSVLVGRLDKLLNDILNDGYRKRMPMADVQMVELKKRLSSPQAQDEGLAPSRPEALARALKAEREAILRIIGDMPIIALDIDVLEDVHEKIEERIKSMFVGEWDKTEVQRSARSVINEALRATGITKEPNINDVSKAIEDARIHESSFAKDVARMLSAQERGGRDLLGLVTVVTQFFCEVWGVNEGETKYVAAPLEGRIDHEDTALFLSGQKRLSPMFCETLTAAIKEQGLK